MRVPSKQTARRLVYQALDALGANAVMRRKQSGLVRVFTLHGVSSPTIDDLWTPMRHQLCAKRFEKLLGALARDYDFVSMDTVTDLLQGKGKKIANAIAVTFDDGYSNNFTEALPVLEKYNAPATFYVTTDAVVSRQPFWFDRLDYALQNAAGTGLHIEFAGTQFRFDSPSRSAAAHDYAALRDHAKRAFDNDADFTHALDELAGRIEQKTGKALHEIIERDHWSRTVTAEEMKAIAGHPLVTIGSHTVSHLRLSFADDEHIARELRESKRVLEEWTGRPVEHFAYPNGAYDERSMSAVRNAGYKSAVTSDSGVNSTGQDLMKINRLSIPSSYVPAEIRARASGLECSIVSRLQSVSRSMARFKLRESP